MEIRTFPRNRFATCLHVSHSLSTHSDIWSVKIGFISHRERRVTKTMIHTWICAITCQTSEFKRAFMNDFIAWQRVVRCSHPREYWAIKWKLDPCHTKCFPKKLHYLPEFALFTPANVRHKLGSRKSVAHCLQSRSHRVTGKIIADDGVRHRRGCWGSSGKLQPLTN